LHGWNMFCVHVDGLVYIPKSIAVFVCVPPFSLA
jgi:hypothetical protein